MREAGHPRRVLPGVREEEASVKWSVLFRPWCWIVGHRPAMFVGFIKEGITNGEVCDRCRKMLRVQVQEMPEWYGASWSPKRKEPRP